MDLLCQAIEFLENSKKRPRESPVQETFRFIGQEKSRDSRFKNCKVYSVIFKTSRRGIHEQSIVFNGGVTPFNAVNQVSRYLSRRMTKKYWDIVKSDIPNKKKTKMVHYPYRSDMLGAATVLYDLHLDHETGTLLLITGDFKSKTN